MEFEGISSEQRQALEPVAVKPRSRRRSITLFAVISAVNVGLLILLWTQLLTPAHQQSATDTSATTLGDISSPLIGKPAPAFTLSTLNGGAQKLSLADFKGKAVILNFWSSACEPCQAEMPFLQKSWQSMQSQGIAFIGIDTPEGVSFAKGFLQKYAITYPNVQDTLNSTTITDYGVTGTPETIFINKSGVVVAKWASPLTEQGWQLEIAKLSRPLQN